jgi:hypothetical protein
MPGQQVTIEDALGPWQIRLVNNRAKSCVTLKVRASHE